MNTENEEIIYKNMYNSVTTNNVKKERNGREVPLRQSQEIQNFISNYYGHLNTINSSKNGTISFSPGYISPRTIPKQEIKTREELLKQFRAERRKSELSLDDDSDGMLKSCKSLSNGTLGSTDCSKPLVKEDNKDENTILICFLYGLINCAIVIPVIMSFGSIIYRDVAFQPYLPTLIKLTTISGVVHQLSFSTISSLPFAVGQVQDAGLIFLSKMASDIVVHCRNYNYSDDHILATTTIGLSLCTAILGMALLIIGRCGLAAIVQKLPVPVVGGYLAFIGFFCGQSGMALMAGINVEHLSDWPQFFTYQRMKLMSPGIVSGLAIYLLARRIRHMAVLPICIMSLIIVFYCVLFIVNMPIDEARDNGWFNEANDPPVWYKTWHFLRPSYVVWSALPQCILTLISMIFVVALSSSLDVAAIELEMGKPLDYNHEITTVGWSNVISGLTGGYTGSYIFSQSIFTLRSGIRSRMCGYFIAFIEVIVVISPFPITTYLPNFFFGSLLIMICVDLMHEWLWDVRNKSTPTEYCIALVTFILIQFAGVEYGILLGLVLFFICYKMGYDVGLVDDTYLKKTEEQIIVPLKNSVQSFLNLICVPACDDERRLLLDDVNADLVHDETLMI